MTEQIIQKRREANMLISQGKAMLEACEQMGWRTAPSFGGARGFSASGNPD